jgi:hypothetical protein
LQLTLVLVKWGAARHSAVKLCWTNKR